MTIEELYIEARLRELEHDLARARRAQEARSARRERSRVIGQPARPSPRTLGESTGW